MIVIVEPREKALARLGVAPWEERSVCVAYNMIGKRGREAERLRNPATGGSLDHCRFYVVTGYGCVAPFMVGRLSSIEEGDVLLRMGEDLKEKLLMSEGQLARVLRFEFTDEELPDRNLDVLLLRWKLLKQQFDEGGDGLVLNFDHTAIGVKLGVLRGELRKNTRKGKSMNLWLNVGQLESRYVEKMQSELLYGWIDAAGCVR